uniref:Repressor domain protein n=1 Tax=Myoviridae sp. ctgr818 TaxID=2825150 RepID=A0A8S5PCN0_9CAUD|nr:MAG TPA: repressor domain protein [Myoviridae sp. ctgr818]
MSNSNLTSYNFHNSDIRVVQNDKGEVLFCLADVCASLNLAQSNKTANQIKEEFGSTELNSALLKNANNHGQQCTMITEPQLYFVMMRSNSKIAREFRQWICNEVLPSIRAQGAYVAKSENKEPATKKWYVEQLTALFESYGVNREVLARTLDITVRAFNQGYAIGINKAEEEHARNDSEMLLSDDEAQAIDHVVHYHKLFRPDILKAYKELRDIKAQAMKLVLALDNIPDARLYESAVATDISVSKLERFQLTYPKKSA